MAEITHKKKGIVGLAKVFISLAIAAIVLVGVVMPQLHPTDVGTANGTRSVWYTNWSVGEIALFGVIGIVAISVLIFSLF